MLKKILLTGAAIMCTATGFGKHDGRYLRDLSMEFETAHLEWASKLRGGKINSLFIVARKGARDVVEVAQRMESGINAVTVMDEQNLAVENMYESAIEGTTVYEKTQELLKKLETKYDLYVIGNFNFNSLPAEAQFKILRQVSGGAGLVFVYPQSIRFKKIFAGVSSDAEGILSLAAKAGMPEKIKDLPDSTLLKTYKFGKGRIAVIDYRAKHPARYRGQALSVPAVYSNRWQAKYENNMVLVMRTLRWAANREAQVKIACPELAASPQLKQKAQDINLQLSSSTAFDGEIELRLRDEFNTVVKRKKMPCNFKNKLKETFSLPLLPAGQYYLDVIVARQGKTDNFGYFAFNVESPVKPVILIPDEVVRHHGPVKAELELNRPVNGSVEVSLSDSPYGRVWFRKSYKLNGRKLNLDIHDYYMPTIAGYLTCAVKQNGNTLALAEKMLFFPDYNLENYLTLCWSCVPGEYTGRFESQQIVDTLGWRAGLEHPSKGGLNARHAAILNQRFVPYTTRIGLKKGKNGEIQQYRWFFLPGNELAAQKALNGDESFVRPEVKRLWAAGIKHKIKNLSKYGPAIYTLGDENFFNIDAGYGKSDQKGFQDFVKRKYGTIAKLNLEWGSSYGSFDAVKHYSLKEAKDEKIYAAWFDHRQYMEKMYADMHHFLAQEIKKYDPDAKVGAEGSIPGDLEQTIKGMEFWGPYSNLVMDEVLRSIGGEKIRMLWWGSYVGSHGGRGEYPLPLWKDLLTGNINGSAWYSASRASWDGPTGASLEFAHYMKKLIPHMMKIENGLGQLLNTVPLENDGIAILWSHASDSARLLEHKFINPGDSTATFIKFCYQNALNFDFLTESGLDKLNKYKVLFLFGASSISGRESAAISQFVNNGGTVIADLNPGILNENLHVMPENQLNTLFGGVTYNSAKAPVLAPLALNVKFKDRDLSLRAEKAGMPPGSKPFMVKRCGKGEAILLNFSLSSAYTTSSKDASLTKFLLDLLSTCGIKAPLSVSGIDKKDSIIRVRKGEGYTLVGLLAGKQNAGGKALVTLPRREYIYSPGEGYIKQGNTITLDLDKPFKLITCFDEQQTAPAVKLSAESARPGTPVFLKLKAYRPGTVLFIQTKGPNGKMLPLRKKVLIIDGKTENYPLNFAFNDADGSYTLMVTDVATGLKTEKQLKLLK